MHILIISITLAVILTVVTFFLIVKQRETAAKLRETEERMRVIADAAPWGFNYWVKDPTSPGGFRNVATNQETVKLFDLSSTQEYIDRFYDLSLLRQPDGELSHEKASKFLKKAFERGYCRFEWMHHKLNGEPVPCEITLVRSRYRGEDIVLGYTRDLREHKMLLAEIEKAHENMRVARDAAEAANKAKSDFLANMSHEIRTPMNSIIGFTELALAGDVTSETSEYLTQISKSAALLLVIIDDILDLSKIESGKMELERVPFDLHEVFARCRLVIQPKADEKGLMLYCYAEPSIGKKLLGDPVRLHQILLNILSNAVKFTNAGAVKLIASVKDYDPTFAVIRFEIKDSGIGMTPEQAARIFQPFTQADTSVTRKYGGTGLGLTITKNLVELMGGELKLESAPDLGSKFSFEIKFDLADENADLPQSHDNMFYEIEMPKFKNREALICEDNRMNQVVAHKHLERVGIKTTIAENGKVALDIVTKRQAEGVKPFDIILMDIHMPVMDGLEAAERITRLNTGSPIIALTANIMAGDVEIYKKCGMNDLMGKPFSSQELWRCLLKHLQE